MTTTTSGERVTTRPKRAAVTVVPDDVKRPEDHKPPKAAKTADAPTVEKVEGGRAVTYRGFTVTVPDEALDDFELLGDLREMQDTADATVLPSLLRRLIGAEGYKTAMNGLRDPETGRVSALDGAEYVQLVFGALAPNS